MNVQADHADVIVTNVSVTTATRRELGNAWNAAMRFARIVKRTISCRVKDAVIELVTCVCSLTLVNLRDVTPRIAIVVWMTR